MATIPDVMLANMDSKATGERLLRDLPWEQKLRARLRSLGLLLVIAGAFWPTVWSVAVICAGYYAWIWIRNLLQQQLAQQHGHDKQRLADQHQQHLKQGQQQDQAADLIPVSYPAAHPATQLQPGKVGTAIVTGGKMTKALHVCRHLHAAGWRVVLVETFKYWHVGSRLSNSVDVFHRVPIPELHPENYAQAIADIARREGATLFIPASSPIASLYDAMAAEALPEGCRSWTLSPDMTALLDIKARFSDYAASLGLLVPQHHVVNSPAQLRALNDFEVLKGKIFILKSLAYDSVHRADLFKLPCAPSALEAYLARPDITISSRQPWILQEFIKGKEFSCYTLAYQGRVVAHADTAAELSNLNYKYEAHPGIRQWVQQFAAGSGASGQLCFDFIESAADGRLYCIECNPRTSSVITEFHDNPEFATAFTSPNKLQRAVEPLPASRPTYWWFNEVTHLITSPGGYWWRFLVVVSHGVDGVFDATDPLPFLGLHFVQVPMLLLNNVLRGNPWTKVDLCICKIAELYGD